MSTRIKTVLEHVEVVLTRCLLFKEDAEDIKGKFASL